MKKYRNMSFNEFIDDMGVDELSKILKTEPRTIYYWKTGRCLPRRRHMIAIKKMSHGEISYDKMIESTPRTTAR